MPRKSLHPNILFHFTSRKGLWGILRDNFKVFYAREKIEETDRATEFYVAMVSFCDLRLSELKEHMTKYKSYGIGLSKTWANKNKLNPVFYVNKHSPLTSEFHNAVSTLWTKYLTTQQGNELSIAAKAYGSIMDMYRYMKNYEGKLERRNRKTIDNYRFADEREWRYIPPISSIVTPFVPLGSRVVSIHSREVADLRLVFEPDDIQYLIIKKDSERLKLIRHLESIKSRFFDPSTISRLTSRIISAEQINNDV